MRIRQRLLGDAHLGHVDQDAVRQQPAGGVGARPRPLVDVAHAVGDLEPEDAVDRGAARQLQVALLDEHAVVGVHGGRRASCAIPRGVVRSVPVTRSQPGPTYDISHGTAVSSSSSSV